MKPFQSKKANMTGIAAIVITLVTLLLTAVDAPDEVIQWVVSVIGIVFASFNIGQGIADVGKGKAEVEEK